MKNDIENKIKNNKNIDNGKLFAILFELNPEVSLNEYAHTVVELNEKNTIVMPVTASTLEI